jgi:hypothetical protein
MRASIDGAETVAGLVAAVLLGADVTRWSDGGIRMTDTARLVTPVDSVSGR